jgi:hypothetical protein
MDQYPGLSSGFSQTCRGCGRTFPQLTAFSNHLSSCTVKKRKLGDALIVAQDAYKERKRQRLKNIEQKAATEPSNSLLPSLSDSILSNPIVCDFSVDFPVNHDCGLLSSI